MKRVFVSGRCLKTWLLAHFTVHQPLVTLQAFNWVTDRAMSESLDLTNIKPNDCNPTFLLIGNQLFRHKLQRSAETYNLTDLHWCLVPLFLHLGLDIDCESNRICILCDHNYYQKNFLFNCLLHWKRNVLAFKTKLFWLSVEAIVSIKSKLLSLELRQWLQWLAMTRRWSALMSQRQWAPALE